MLLLPYLLTPLYRVVDPVSTPMLARWALGKRVDRTFVPLERIAPVLPRSVIASEDGRFCSHHGIDWTELRSSIEDAEEKLKYDLFYVKNNNLLFDFLILIQTFEVVLFGRGVR